MTITLTAEQEAWVKEAVACGAFASVEAAVRQLIDERTAERACEGADDLAWAASAVEKAFAEVGRGDVITLEEHEARTKARLAAMKP